MSLHDHVNEAHACYCMSAPYTLVMHEATWRHSPPNRSEVRNEENRIDVAARSTKRGLFRSAAAAINRTHTCMFVGHYTLSIRIFCTPSGDILFCEHFFAKLLKLSFFVDFPCLPTQLIVIRRF